MAISWFSMAWADPGTPGMTTHGKPNRQRSLIIFITSSGTFSSQPSSPFLISSKRFIGINIEICFVIMMNIFDFIIGYQVAIQINQVHRRIKPHAVHDIVVLVSWINKKFEISAEKCGKRLQNSTR